jgi:hypothetical protein
MWATAPSLSVIVLSLPAVTCVEKFLPVHWQEVIHHVAIPWPFHHTPLGGFWALSSWTARKKPAVSCVQPSPGRCSMCLYIQEWHVWFVCWALSSFRNFWALFQKHRSSFTSPWQHLGSAPLCLARLIGVFSLIHFSVSHGPAVLSGCFYLMNKWGCTSQPFCILLWSVSLYLFAHLSSHWVVRVL